MQENSIQSIKCALEADQQGLWNKAHEIIQSINHPLAYQVHAYLHRKEGSLDTALFWYGRAGIKPFQGLFEQEFAILKENAEQIQYS